MSNFYYIRTIALGCLVAFSAGSMQNWLISMQTRTYFDFGIEIIFQFINSGWLGATLFIGAIIAPALVIFDTKRWGNKLVLIAPLVSSVAAIIIFDVANIIELHYVAQVLAGIGMGSAIFTVLTYFAEISEPSKRVMALASVNVAMTFGKLITYVCMMNMSHLGTNLVLGIIFAVTAILCGFFAPQSPYFLMHKKREPEAIVVLTDLRAGKFEQSELEEIREIGKATPSKSNITLVVCILFIIEKFTGIFINDQMTLNAAWTSAWGYSSAMSIQIIYYVIQILAGLLGLGLLSKLKQSTVLAISCIVMAICNIAFAVITNNSPDINAWIAVGIIWTIAYHAGLALIPWILMVEMLPVYRSSIGLVGAASLNWFFWAFAVMIIPEILKSLTVNIFWLQTTFSILGAIVPFLSVPDTRGKSLKKSAEM